MSSYFSLPSFARAKKNKEDLEKMNPTEPVLKDEDEKYLTRVTSQEAAAPEQTKEVTPMRISDDGKAKEAPEGQAEVEGATSSDQVAVPEAKFEEAAVAETGEGKDEDKAEQGKEEVAEDPPEVAPDAITETPERPTMKQRKSKKNAGFDLPSQEEAEAATRGFSSQNAEQAQEDASSGTKQQGDKRTWASYLPSIPKGSKKDASTEADTDKASVERVTDDNTHPQSRTWAEYATAASSYASAAASNLPSLPASWTRSNDKDSTASPVYNEDGTINEQATKEKQEKEVSVLLDNLSLSNINNRVFSFSAESQKYYDRFTQVLRDTLDGAPTAYDDMDKLMRDAGPTLEKNFNSMPPFVQTLVKALPAKLGTTLGPEIMAAASEKPGNDMKARMAATNDSGSADQGSKTASAEQSTDAQKKKKRKIPGLKGLVSEQGMVATMLRNIVNFLRVRFPFLMSTTNVVMSLAVFILMFVFWYCHKRGKESRLLKESATSDGAVDEKSREASDAEYSESSEDEAQGDAGAEEVAGKIAESVKDGAASARDSSVAKQEILGQKEPAQVPLPETKEEN